MQSEKIYHQHPPFYYCAWVAAVHVFCCDPKRSLQDYPLFDSAAAHDFFFLRIQLKVYQVSFHLLGKSVNFPHSTPSHKAPTETLNLISPGQGMKYVHPGAAGFHSSSFLSERLFTVVAAHSRDDRA
jgi:hypothetical protein